MSQILLSTLVSQHWVLFTVPRHSLRHINCFFEDINVNVLNISCWFDINKNKEKQNS